MSAKFVFLKSMDILKIITQYHVFILIFIVFCIFYIFIKKIYHSKHSSVNNGLELKLEEWRPEPLISESPKNHPSFSPKKIASRVGKRIVIDDRNCLNLSAHNYLGLTENIKIENKIIEIIQKYGVGSCGPRGFYGTVDVHLNLENFLAQFMQMEEAIVYSYGFSTIASAIPAYCKRTDIVFADEKINYSIRKGLDASRSYIRYFKHNDIKDLEILLKSQTDLSITDSNIEKTRKFLIIEGIYANTGTVCPLPELLHLCKKYKLRIFIDESLSFGSLGATGRGVTEYFNVSRDEIDMIIGSLEWAIGSIGGFCVGSSFIIEHQRLSGLGYCFSASLPPLLTSAAIAALNIVENRPHLFKTLERNCYTFHKGLQKIKIFECNSSIESPVQYLFLKKNYHKTKEEKIINEICNKCLEHDLIILIPAYLTNEKECLRPSLKICISATLNESDIEFALSTLEKCAIYVTSM